MAAHAANGTQPDHAYDFGGGPAEWSIWYTQYLTRATGQSAKTLELYQQVLECVSRGQLAPTVIQDLLPGFAQARGTEYTTKLAELSSRFFRGLVEIGTVYSREQAELIMPEVPLPQIPPPQLDTTDPVKWFEQLTEYVGHLNARAVKAYQSHLERVAAGEATTAQLQQATSDYHARRLPEHLRQVGQLYFELLNGLNDVRIAYEKDFLAGVLASAKHAGQEIPFVLNLTAPLGETASASLSLSNTRQQRSLIRCTVTAIRRADGVGPAFAPKVTITPEALELAPGQDGSLRLSLQLDADDFTADALYIGAVHLTGHGEPRLEVPLQITATPITATQTTVSEHTTGQATQ